MRGNHAAAYGFLVVLNAGVTQLAIQLGAGEVPLPPEWRWCVPTLTAILTAAGALLPRLGGDDHDG